MELVHILRRVWARKLWLAPIVLVALYVGLNAGYNVSLIPPEASPDRPSFAAASTEFLVDSNRSAVTDIDRDISALSTRAVVLTAFARSEDVRGRVAVAADIPPELISIESRDDIDRIRAASEPGQIERGTDILGQEKPYRLVFTARRDYPVVSVSARAPTVDEAIRLADAAVVGLGRAVRTIARSSPATVERTRVGITPLGEATGGTVGASGSAVISAAVALAALGLGVCALLLIDGLVVHMRNVRGDPTEARKDRSGRRRPKQRRPDRKGAAGDRGGPRTSKPAR